MHQRWFWLPATGYNINIDGKTTVSGLMWDFNVCGILKPECSNPQFCAGADGKPTFSGATQCLSNPQQPKVGMAIQRNYTGMPDSPNGSTCTRCEVAADKPTQGTFSVMRDGDTPNPGVRIVYPLVPETANEDGSWNSCTDVNDGRIATYELNCDCQKSNPVVDGVYSVMEQCNYTIKVHAAAACPIGFCSNQGGSRSGGTKFLITITVLGILRWCCLLHQLSANGYGRDTRVSPGRFQQLLWSREMACATWLRVATHRHQHRRAAARPTFLNSRATACWAARCVDERKRYIHRFMTHSIL